MRRMDTHGVATGGRCWAGSSQREDSPAHRPLYVYAQTTRGAHGFYRNAAFWGAMRCLNRDAVSWGAMRSPNCDAAFWERDAARHVATNAPRDPAPATILAAGLICPITVVAARSRCPPAGGGGTPEPRAACAAPWAAGRPADPPLRSGR